MCALHRALRDPPTGTHNPPQTPQALPHTPAPCHTPTPIDNPPQSSALPHDRAKAPTTPANLATCPRTLGRYEPLMAPQYAKTQRSVMQQPSIALFVRPCGYICRKSRAFTSQIKIQATCIASSGLQQNPPPLHSIL